MNFLDKVIVQVDLALKTLLLPHETERKVQCEAAAGDVLNEKERQHSVALMRINHCGEISAQALYRSQAFVARNQQTVRVMQQCAAEEVDHLAWCEERIEQLGGRVSYLCPVWYLGSFAIGLLAGIAGDAYNLGFIDETEQQVATHLDSHLDRISEKDTVSIAVIQQMREDELRHGATAREQGAKVLPAPVKQLMRCVAKVMTKTAYYI